MAIETFEQCRLNSERRWHEIGLELQKIKDDQTSMTLRLNRQEKMVEDIQSLSQSVAILANNMDAMLKEQQSQNRRLSSLEEKPAKKYDTLIDTIVKVVLTAALGVILVKIGLQ